MEGDPGIIITNCNIRKELFRNLQSRGGMNKYLQLNPKWDC